MENNIIKIPAVDYGKVSVSEDILISLGNIANNYRFCINDPSGHLDLLIKEYKLRVNESLKALDIRKDIWKKLLGKYYKMTCKKETDGYTYETISYIFPYRVIDENNTLWMLEVRDGSKYKGGVCDINHTIDEEWNYDTYLEEITEDDFRNKAIEATKYVIDRRLHRLSEEKPQYRIINTEEEIK